MNVQYLDRPGYNRLAYVHTPGHENSRAPAVMFLGGYHSDMNGTKATFLESACGARGQEYVRFDYSGHGLSDGMFQKGTIGQWKDDALAVLDSVPKGPVILAGSSMGGWIGLLLTLARPEKIAGFVGIAAAPDFTEDIYASLNAAQKIALKMRGSVAIPNDYGGESYTFTKKIYEEAANHLLLKETHAVSFPVRLIQGMQDREVPWRMTDRIKASFTAPNFDITLIEDGDHRLSRPEDLAVIDARIRALSEGK